MCPNQFGCPAQLKGRIQHFGSRTGLDIEGLGEETATMFVERGVWVRPFGKLVYTMPPYVMCREDLDTLTAAMVDVVAKL